MEKDAEVGQFWTPIRPESGSFLHADSHLGKGDPVWLFEDLSGRPLEKDRQIALHAIVSVLSSEHNLEKELPRLRMLISGVASLEMDLEGYLHPSPSPEIEEYQRKSEYRRKEYERQSELKQQADKASWKKFREALQADLKGLRDGCSLSSWSAGAHKLHFLNCWLEHRTDKRGAEASLQWRLLAEGFGQEVAEAFRDGMEILWRVTPPERPKHKGNQITIKHTTILAFAGLAVEAAEDQDWVSHLNAVEIERATQHACHSEQRYPNWLEPLFQSHPSIVLPILRQTLKDEWLGRFSEHSIFLAHYASDEKTIPGAIQEILFSIITGKKPKHLDMVSTGCRVLQHLDLSKDQQQRVASLAHRRISVAQSVGDDGFALTYLTMLLTMDPDAGTSVLNTWLSATPSGLCTERTKKCLGALFGRSGSLGSNVFERASAASLEALVRLVYSKVENDEEDSGGDRPRWDVVSEARNTVLVALINKPGAEAFRVFRTLAGEPAVGRAIRFREISHEKAERDAEPPAWKPAEVIAFEHDHVAPAKTGQALLRVVMGLLSDIQSSFDNADATSRALLQRAKDEDEVQKWLAEQLNLRSQGRFHAHREAEVSQGDKPDIVVSSAAAQVEVAVEVKHGGMKWTVRDLEKALKKQLAEGYLKPLSRRHGVLVVSSHGIRTWRSPETKANLTFQDVIKRLQRLGCEK